MASVLIAASVLLHLSTTLGRAAAADLTAEVVNSRIRGTLHVGSITRLDFGGVEMRDVHIASPAGEEVMSADRMSARFAFGQSIRRRALVLSGCEMEGGGMHITRGPRGQIALVDALEVPADRFTIPVEFPDVRLIGQTFHMALPGLPLELEMRDVGGPIDLTLGHSFSTQMHRLRGFVNFPVVHIGFSRLSGRMRSGSAQPLVARLVLDLEVADPGMEMTYSAPGAVGAAGDPHASLALASDVP